MASLNYTTAFNRYKAKLDNPNWQFQPCPQMALWLSVAGNNTSNARQMEFFDTSTRCRVGTAAIVRVGTCSRRHLEMTLAGDLEVRLVLAKTDNPNAVAKGGDARQTEQHILHPGRSDWSTSPTTMETTSPSSFVKALQLVDTHTVTSTSSTPSPKA